MKKTKILAKKALVVVVAIAAFIAVGLIGQLDHDEYIEANSTPKPRMPYWYEN